MRYTGPWVSGSAYVAQDLATYLGSAYVCTADVLGSATPPPSDSGHWALLISGAGSFGRYDQVTPSSSWVIAHTLGRTPLVQVFDAAGNQVIVDVQSGSSSILVTFSTPMAGFALYE